MTKALFSSSALAIALVMTGSAHAQNETWSFSTVDEGGAWDALLHEASESGNYFLDNQGPDSTNAFIMQPTPDPVTVPPTQLIIFRDSNGDGMSNDDPIDINAVLTVQDASDVDQDFSVNSLDWRSVFNGPEFGQASLTGMLDGEMVWQVAVGFNAVTTLSHVPADAPAPDFFAGEVPNLNGTIDQMVWALPGYIDNTWNPSSIDNLDIDIVTTSGGLEADFNGDGTVDLLDLDVLGQNWQMAGTQSTGDANGDGTVDLLDLDLLGQQWQQSGSFASALAASGIAVPEPASVALLGLGGLAVLRRRR